MKSVQLFFEKLKSDRALQEKLMEMQDKGKEEALEAIIILAKENGFEIRKEDILAHIEVINEKGELNEMELDSVAGGGALNWIVATVMSLGILCAVTAAAKALINYCGLDNDGYNDADYNG